MRRWTGLFFALAILLAAMVRTGAAQAPAALVEQGVQSYADLALNDAAGFLRRALNPGTGLATADQARALMYLGATEALRGNADSAASAFRSLVLVDPRYRPDPLTFPPEVTTVFEAVRRDTKTVTVSVPPETDMLLGAGRISSWVYASSPHELTAEITYDDGRPARTLYTGPISDSLQIQWDARDADGRVVTSGGYLLNLVSRDPAGRMLRLSRVPLDVDVRLRDTIPHPPSPADSMLLPERYDRRPSLEALVGGVVVGVAVLALPAALAPEADLTGGRFAVAGAVSIAGVAGFVTRRPGQPIRANIAANQALRAEWRDSVAVVARENAARRVDIRVLTRAGTPVRIEGVGQ